MLGSASLFAQNVYVSNEAGQVFVVNSATGAVAATLQVSGAPAGMATTPGGQQLYVARYSANSVAIFDTGSDTEIAAVPVGKLPLWVAIPPNGQTAYVVNTGSNSVSAISTATKAVVATVPVGSGPRKIAVTPDSSRVFVANYTSGTVSVISTTSNSVVATWPAAYGVNAVAVSPDGSRLYVANPTSNQVTVFDVASGELLKTIGGFNDPDSFGIVPNGGTLYVSNGNGKSVSVINTASLEIETTVQVGPLPRGIAISLDGSEAFVADMGANSLSVIGTATNSVVKTVAHLVLPFAAVVVPAKPAAQAPPSLCSAASAGLPALPASVVLPELPQSCSVPVYPSPASTVSVNTAAELQAALTGAQCGQSIQVQAGLTLVDNFVVPGLACPENAPVLVASSAISTLPQWVVPARTLAGSSQVATLASPNSTASLTVSDGAANWYFAGLEFTVTPAAQYVYPIVDMGDQTTTVAALPHNIVFDRVLVHPAPCPASGVCNYVQRGITMNCVNCATISSNIWGIVNPGQDAQAIMAYNTTGPILIANNDLEASGENVIFNTECPITGYVPGGSVWGIPGCPVPSDITVRRNHFIKQAAWQSLPVGCSPATTLECYDVKDSFEIKHAQRVLLDSNWFDTTFNEGQDEFIIMNCFYNPYQVCTDFTVTNNLFEHGPIVGVVVGFGNSQTGQRVMFRNNLAVDINAITWGGRGLSFQINQTNGFIADHNTVINEPPLYNIGLAFSDPPPSSDTNFAWTNNLSYGSPFGNGMGPGQTIAALPSPAFGGAVFVGDTWTYANQNDVANPPAYPAGISSLSAPGCTFNTKVIASCWPLDWAMVGFVDFEGGNAGTDLAGLALSTSSPQHNAATDGMDIGANIPAVLAAINGVR
jgi:YVTN family beta-propeller protein